MAIHPETKIGHIHLTVSDLDRSLAFYRDLLGFEVTARFGDSAVFLSAGGYHHHIGLNTWAGKGATPPPPGHTGIYHHAILFPSRRELAVILKRLIDSGYPITGTADHGVSEAIYLNDPDGIGVELYADRPRSRWLYRSTETGHPINQADLGKVKNDGQVEMTTEPLDTEDLLKEIKK